MSAPATESGMLHLLLSADQDALRDCRACAADGDTVVLLADGVMGLAFEGRIGKESFAGRLVVSGPDARARGLPEHATRGFECVDDPAIVALIESHRHCLSWR